MSHDPYRPSLPDADESSGQQSPADLSSGKAAYNLVSDVVVGVNVRRQDNLFQALFILATVILGFIMGGIIVGLAETDVPWIAGGVVGAFAGLVGGLFLSGIALMIYRGVRHWKGKHD